MRVYVCAHISDYSIQYSMDKTDYSVQYSLQFSYSTGSWKWYLQNILHLPVSKKNPSVQEELVSRKKFLCYPEVCGNQS